MISIAPIYLPYLVLIDCCMPTSDMLFGQILNPETKSFFGTDGEYVLLSHLVNCKL
jgi:hypothetical protein